MPLIKYERDTSLDDTEGDLVSMSGHGMDNQTGTLSVAISGDNNVTLPIESTDDDQPCDLRLSSFRMNLVSMALQQAAAAVISGGTVTSPAGMQQSTLQTIAATPTTHLTSLINFSQPHVPTQITTQSTTITSARRYSTSTSSVVPPSGVGSGVGPTNRVSSPKSANTKSVPPIQTESSSIAASGPSTSAAAAAAAANSAQVPGGGSICSDEAVTTGALAISNSGSTGGGSGGHITPITTGGSSGSFGGAYTCERCGNSYARPHSLNRHMRFECGVEPKFECPICHKKSKHKHNLVLHMRTHQHR
ncbi:protein krueppel-like [Eurosta solidaginis]|uniref:protein krueppel-like n=1 Tax=Eurosta solidaginis TaxID=178769 RepID=UPI00353080A0